MAPRGDGRKIKSHRNAGSPISLAVREGRSAFLSPDAQAMDWDQNPGSGSLLPIPWQMPGDLEFQNPCIDQWVSSYYFTLLYKPLGLMLNCPKSITVGSVALVIPADNPNFAYRRKA